MRVKSMGDIIVGGLVAVVIGLILWKMIRDKKTGKSSCSGCKGCSGCGGGGCSLAADLSAKFPENGEKAEGCSCESAVSGENKE